MLDGKGLRILGLAALFLGAGGVRPGELHAQAARPKLSEMERRELEVVLQNELKLPSMLGLIAELTRVIPDSAWVEYLSIRGRELRFKLQTDPGSISQIGDALRQSPWFDDVKALSAQGNTVSFEPRISEAAAYGGEAASDAEAELLPYASQREAEDRINEQLQQAATRSGVELSNVRPEAWVDVSRHFQRISVQLRASAQTQAWLQLLEEIELLRPRLDLDELTVRVPPSKSRRECLLMIRVSGIIKKPAASGTAEARRSKKLRPTAPLPDPAEIAARDLFSPDRKPWSEPGPTPAAGAGSSPPR